MKMTDRIQALKYSPKYKRDYEIFRKKLEPGQFFKSVGSGAECIIFPLPRTAQIFCNRWRIPFPVNPDDDHIIFPRDANAEEIKKLRKEFDVFPAVLEKPRRGRAGKTICGLDESLCLTVTIDMTQPFSDIQSELKKYYDRYSPQVKPRNKRNSDSKLPVGELDHWDVYRRTMNKELPKDIARSLTGSKEGINSDPKLKASYEAVKRAFKKAEQQIKEVEETIHN